MNCFSVENGDIPFGALVKMTQLLISSFQEHGSGSCSGARDFNECDSGARFFSWLGIQLRLLFVFTH